MGFGNKKNLVGLDIGSSAIKVAEITDSKNGPVLRKFGIVDMPHGAIEEGVIKDPEEVADAIRQLFRTFNIKQNNVAISIGGYSVVVKKINVQTYIPHPSKVTFTDLIDYPFLFIYSSMLH